MKGVAPHEDEKVSALPHQFAEGEQEADCTSRVAEDPSDGSQPAPILYDAEDIEEANRIGAALCRQHAR